MLIGNPRMNRLVCPVYLKKQLTKPSHLFQVLMSRAGLASFLTISTPSSPFISVCVPSSAFARMDQEPISHQSSKDSFEYYATCAPCRRCARCHRRWLQAPLTSPGRLRFRFFLRWRVNRLASARKNSIISLMCCCSGSLSTPLRGSVACMSRLLDSGGASPPAVSD